MNEKVKTILIIVLALIGLGAAVYGLTHRQLAMSPAADAAFRTYFVAQIKSTQLNESSDTHDTQNAYTFKTVMDESKPDSYAGFSESGELSCSVKAGGENTSVSLGLQADTRGLFFNVHHINGKITFSDGQTFDLNKLYSSETNKWYMMNKYRGLDYLTTKQRLFLLKIAYHDGQPDMGSLANELLKHKAVRYSLVSQDSGVYTFNVETYPEQYKAAMAAVYAPSLKQTMSESIDTIFDGAKSAKSTIKLTSDGTLIDEVATEHNICQEMTGRFIGVNTNSAPAQVRVTTVPQAPGSVTITPVAAEEYENEDTMQARQTIYYEHTGRRL